ncbi:MAG: enoyl-CoA hydratase [Variibacter sp.]
MQSATALKADAPQPGNVLSSKEGFVGTITFNNPARLNAMSLDMWTQTAALLRDFAEDDAVRVVILKGAGEKAFVSGADISKFESERASAEAQNRYNEAVDKVYGGLDEYPKPIIAMIRGYCVGGGLGLSMSCDLRICTPNSRFALPAAKLGLGYGYRSIKRFVDVLGPAFTQEIFFTARQFSAQEAYDMGLVNRIVADAELESYVKNYADTIGGNAPLTIKAAKFAIRQASKADSERDLKTVGELVKACMSSNDYIEGRRAFMEKRKPKFTGT